jgi:flavin prenyltransferase
LSNSNQVVVGDVVDDTIAKKKLLVAVTGASGMIYVPSLLNELNKASVTIHGICSSSGREVLSMEQNLQPEQLTPVEKWFDERDFSAPPASGSSDYHAMVIIPCTMGTLASVAGGLSINLIHRAADVMLKERRQLILAVRETPLNRNHLQNMLRVHDAGGIICPAMPGYYLNPKTIEEAAMTFAWKITDLLNIHVPNRKRWEGKTS